MRSVVLTMLTMVCVFVNARSFTEVTAMYTYQFTKLIQWPDEAQDNMFRIGVIGSFESYKGIMEVTMGRKVGNLNIEVMNVMRIDQLSLSRLHILVVGENFCNDAALSQIQKNLKSPSTVLIAESPSYNGKNINIKFVQGQDCVSYAYFKQSLKSKGLYCARDFFEAGVNLE